MATVLLVHHTVSLSTEALLDAALAGLAEPELTEVEVVAKSALSATVSDVLAADAYVLGTPANIGYMSGAMKYFFDQIYYPTRNETAGRGYGVYVHGNDDCTGAVNAITKIAKGVGWTPVFDPIAVTGEPTKADLERCHEMAATVASTLIA